MADHLTEQEQIESIKRWWADNGRGIITGIVLALAGYFGYQWWQTDQRTQAENASNLYQTFVEAVTANGGQPNDKQLTTAKSLAKQLKEEYGKHIYASQAALRMAALNVKENNLEAAAEQLQWALDNVEQDALKFLAQRRLAAVIAAQGQYEEALTALNNTASGPIPSAFAALFAETRGDILLQQGDENAARNAYEQAKAQLLPEQANISQLLDMKLSSIPEQTVETTPKQGPQQVPKKIETDAQSEQESSTQ